MSVDFSMSVSLDNRGTQLLMLLPGSVTTTEKSLVFLSC